MYIQVHIYQLVYRQIPRRHIHELQTQPWQINGTTGVINCCYHVT